MITDSEKTDKYNRLLPAILRMLIDKGLKGLTMDLLASELSMSKRTLYELFDSKHNLISVTLDYMFGIIRRMSREIFQASPDIITALSEIFHLQAELLCMLSIDFFHDMDTLYPDIKRIYEENHDAEISDWEVVYQRGIEEGLLREDVNHEVLCYMMKVQMEALKRMENEFAGKFTLEEIFITITDGFLRSIATTEGIKKLENFLPTARKDLYQAILGQ